MQKNTSKLKIIFFAIVFLGFFCSVQTSSAKELYVNGTTGNDSTTYANNDAAHPWATIKRAAWGSTVCASKVTGEAAQAGDTVNVAAGTYAVNRDCANSNSTPTYNPINTGTSGYPITFKASGTVVLTQTGNTGPVIGATDKAYIVWDGFYIDEANVTTASDTGPVVICHSDHVTIQNCTIIGAAVAWSDNHVGIRIMNGATYPTIRNNKISNFYFGPAQTWDPNACAIQSYNSSYFTIENNEIFNCASGIFLKAAVTRGLGDTIIRNNLIHDITNTGIWFFAIQEVAPTSNVKVYKNIIRDSGAGAGWTGNTTGADPSCIYGKFVNNTIDNCTKGMGVSWVSYFFGDIGWNNIVTNSTHAVSASVAAEEAGRDVHIGEKSHIDFDHNLYYGFTTAFSSVMYEDMSFATWKATYSQDLASLNSNPLYVDGSGDNFKLQGGSPAINAGVDILDLDNDGNTTDAITMGAYITGNEVIGVDDSGTPPDTVPPGAPSGLSVQ